MVWKGFQKPKRLEVDKGTLTATGWKTGGGKRIFFAKGEVRDQKGNLLAQGEGVFGAEAAARHHFGVPASRLDDAQAAWLAAILPSPRRYARGETTPYLDSRIATIRRHMGYAQIP